MDWRAKTGRVVGGVELRIVDDEGNPLPWDGEAVGEIEVRGPWITASYYRDDAPEKFDDGWLRTGDVGSVTPKGFIQITDRAKDVIKSGGEWISSVELENQLMAHPDVLEASVIGVPDPRWDERPLACVVARTASVVDAAELAAFLGEHVAKWQVPERWASSTRSRRRRSASSTRRCCGPGTKRASSRCEQLGLKQRRERATDRAEAARASTPRRPRRSCCCATASDGLEVLLGRRSSKLAFHGGAWVFPGGRIDPDDYGDDPDDLDAAARRAAVREAKEEAGVDVDPDALVHLSNWTTPEISPKRFATWFFAGPVAGGDRDRRRRRDRQGAVVPARRGARRARGGRDRARAAAVRHAARPARRTRPSPTRWPASRPRADRLPARASTSSKAAARCASTPRTSRTTTSRSSTRPAPATGSYLGDDGLEVRPRLSLARASPLLVRLGREPQVRLQRLPALRELRLRVLVGDGGRR